MVEVDVLVGFLILPIQYGLAILVFTAAAPGTGPGGLGDLLTNMSVPDVLLQVALTHLLGTNVTGNFLLLMILFDVTFSRAPSNIGSLTNILGNRIFIAARNLVSLAVSVVYMENEGPVIVRAEHTV